MKTSIFIRFCLGLLILCSLSGYAIDTLKIHPIEEVSVTLSRSSLFSDDKRVIKVDSLSERIFQHGDLGQLLSGTMPLNIRQYGAEGAISMVSMRGLRVNHVQVNWNGIPLSSLTTGDNDLSMIPAGFMDQVQLNVGAPGSIYGSGTVGGAIDMSNEPDWNNRIDLKASSEIGSFHLNKYKLTARAGNSSFQYHMGVNRYRAENDFTYNDVYQPGSPKIRIRNNSFSSAGLMQNLFLRLPRNHYLQAGMWLQYKDKEIPEVMGKPQTSYAKQKDSTFKAYILWSKVFRSSRITIKTAYLSDILQYRYKPNINDEEYLEDSKYHSQRFYNDLSYRYYFTKGLTLDVGGIFQYGFTDASIYGHQVDEKRLSFIAAGKYRMKQFVLNASLRTEYVDNRSPKLLYSMGFNYNYKTSQSIKANISNKYRTPTFNERFYPGGDPDIQPEVGWSAEISSENSFAFAAGNQKFTFVNTLYYTRVDHLIQWITVPRIHPVPVESAASAGYELLAGYTFRYSNLLIESNLNLVLCHSVISNHLTRDDYIGNYLLYAPVTALNGSVKIHYRNIYGGFNTGFTGRRYSTEDNNPVYSLDPYSVSESYIGMDVKFLSLRNSVLLRLSNIFNTGYEVVKSYAMPGRAFYISILFGLSKN